MRVSRVAVSLAVATVFSLLSAHAAQARSASDDTTPAGVTVGSEEHGAEQVREYWTPDRVRLAVQREAEDRAAVDRAAADQGARPSPGPQEKAELSASAPANLPAGARTFAPRADVPEMPASRRVPHSTSRPNVIIGKIFYRDHAGQNHACSGSVITSETRSAVWTAGHCVHPGDGSGADGFYDEILFIPGYKGLAGDDYQAPWGKWAAHTKIAPEGWTEDEDYRDSDLAAVTVTPPKGYGKIENEIGALGYEFGEGPDYDDVIDYGYPHRGYQRPDLNGKHMMFCTGNAEDAFDWFPLDDRLKVDCDMGEGSSGGPVFTPSWQIVGANSHHEEDDDGNRTNDDLYSSEHGTAAVNVINAVNDNA